MPDDTLLTTTLELYRRSQLGLRSSELPVRNCAETCMSYLTYHLDKEFVVLPDYVAERFHRLPER